MRVCIHVCSGPAVHTCVCVYMCVQVLLRIRACVCGSAERSSLRCAVEDSCRRGTGSTSQSKTFRRRLLTAALLAAPPSGSRGSSRAAAHTGACDGPSVRPQGPSAHRDQLAGLLSRAASCCPCTLGLRADGAASGEALRHGGDGRGHGAGAGPAWCPGRLQPQGLHREDEREHRCDLESLVQTPGRRRGKTSFTHWSPSTCSDLQGTLREVSERTTTYSFNRPGRLSELDGKAQVPGGGLGRLASKQDRVRLG